nr:hypothetical protein [Methanobacterium formicicum]
MNILNAILGAIGGMLIALLLLMVYNRFNQKKIEKLRVFFPNDVYIVVSGNLSILPTLCGKKNIDLKTIVLCTFF